MNDRRRATGSYRLGGHRHENIYQELLKGEYNITDPHVALFIAPYHGLTERVVAYLNMLQEGADEWWEYATTITDLPAVILKHHPDAVGHRITGDDRHVMCPDDLPDREEQARVAAAGAGGTAKRRRVYAGAWEDF